MALVTFTPAKNPLVNNGRSLRGTLAYISEDPTQGILGIELPGCLARRLPDGRLHFSPPLIKTDFGKGGWRRLVSLTPDLANLAARMIEESEYAEMIGKTVKDAPGMYRELLGEGDWPQGFEPHPIIRGPSVEIAL